MSGRYDQGDRVELYANFVDDQGAAADPTTVTVSVRSPDQAVTTYVGGDLEHPATGDYRREINLDQPGLWHYRIAGEGAVIAAAEAVLNVRHSTFV